MSWTFLPRRVASLPLRLLMVASLVAVVSANQGVPEDFFGVSLGSGFEGETRVVHAVAMQGDRIVVVGDYATLDGVSSRRIARLEFDGSPDTGFTSNIGTGFSGPAYAVLVQEDGKIVVGGGFDLLNDVTANRIARLSAAGVPDGSFTTNTGSGFGGGPVLAMAEDSSGRIVAGGLFTTLNGATANGIARLSADGTPDGGFASNVGTGFDEAVSAMAIQQNLGIVVGGAFLTVNGVSSRRLARISSIGSPDVTFANNVGTLFNLPVQAVAVQTDGKIVVGGEFGATGGFPSSGIARLNADGTLDTAFMANLGQGLNGVVEAIALAAHGKIIVGGTFTTVNGVTSNRIARLKPDGTPDRVFTGDVGSGFDAAVESLTLQDNGKLVVGGAFRTVNGDSSRGVARLGLPTHFADPILDGMPIKVLHITELRVKINSVRRALGLANFAWTDPVLESGMAVRAAHIADLRTALEEAYLADGRSAVVYTDATLTPGSSLIRSVHVHEIRAVLRDIE